MTIPQDSSARKSSNAAMCASSLEDKFEVLKDIGDGSFGSVVLARVRTAGAHVARRGSVVAIKTMKKTFDSFQPCLELREVIFLRSLPNHAHLVPALEIFLDPMTKKLHICMEYMDGNLYQLMKARDHKHLDNSSVKSILYQILSGLDHIHAHNFFHRDIKPENILVSSSAPHDTGINLRRYSSLVTPPSTPPLYTVKIADFGLARETHSRHPYTTYVSTRWYRAPEVLLRAGQYSSPVDIWAIGAMAVEIANLKPLFPGGNEVDQVWRVCEIMGSPGNWYDKNGSKVGGGDWREGTRLAQALGFSFPKMAPHSMETILRPPQWPAALSNFVTWCLMWDPRSRPTSAQAMNHEYFADAVDPLRPKVSSASRLLGRKTSGLDSKEERPSLSSKSSWFRKSLITAKDSSLAVSQQSSVKVQTESPCSPPVYPKYVHAETTSQIPTIAGTRPFASKRATWTHGVAPANGAPMPILPSIRPISPFSDAVTAQAHSRLAGKGMGDNLAGNHATEYKASKKIGRQLSVASNGNHYADYHRQEAERALNGNRDAMSPNGYQKESFFSHLRKRARRLSGRPQVPLSPNSDDVEASAGCGPWQSSNRSSMVVDSISDSVTKKTANEGEKSFHSSRLHLEQSGPPQLPQIPKVVETQQNHVSVVASERHHQFPQGQQTSRSVDSGSAANGGPISSRTRRALHVSNQPVQMYEIPDEEDELVHEALSNGAHKKQKDNDQRIMSDKDHRTKEARHLANEKPRQPLMENDFLLNPYPTPSTSSRRNGVLFSQSLMEEPITPLNISKARTNGDISPKWPTPPYSENEWAASAAASIFAAGAEAISHHLAELNVSSPSAAPSFSALPSGTAVCTTII